jgi:hypothetical protein
MRHHEGVDDDIDVATTLRTSVVNRIAAEMVKLREAIEVLPEIGCVMNAAWKQGRKRTAQQERTDFRVTARQGR